MGRSHRITSGTISVPGAFLAIILGVTATFVGVGASAATPAPTSIAPTSGAVGTSVTVTGTGFTSPGLSATVAGEPVTVTVNSSTSATLVVPGDAPSGTVTIALSNGGSALSPSFSFTVFQFTSGFADAEVGANYTPRVGVTGGKAPYTWLVASGTLPAGLSFSSSGAFSGAPKASGASTVTVQATDANGGAAQYLLTITVDPGPTIVTASFPTATIDTAYSTTLSVIGGTPPYSWAIASGPIPGGLVLSSTGVLSGRPGALGGSSIAVRVSDSVGSQNSRVIPIVVRPVPEALTLITTSGTAETTSTVLPPAAVVAPSPGAVGVAGSLDGTKTWMVTEAGSVFGLFGTTPLGGLAHPARRPVVGIAARPDGSGVLARHCEWTRLRFRCREDIRVGPRSVRGPSRRDRLDAEWSWVRDRHYEGSDLSIRERAAHTFVSVPSSAR